MKTDSFWKEVLEKLFPEFLQFFFPEIHRDIDFSKKYQFLDKEFQQISKVSAAKRKIVDKLVKVFLKNGSEKWLLIHIEIQGQKEKDFAKRMFIYNYRIFDKYQKEVISLALLTDQDVSFRPNIYKVKRWGFEYTFKFPLVKIIDYIGYEFEKECRKNVFALLVQAFLKTMETEGDDQTRFRWKRQFILRLYELGFSHETLFKIYQFIEWIMEVPESLDDQLFQEVKQIEEHKTMTLITYAERKGMKEGIHKGKLEGLRKAIEAVLEVKFGKIDQSILNLLLKIQSVEKLEELLHQAKITTSIKEFRKKNLM